MALVLSLRHRPLPVPAIDVMGDCFFTGAIESAGTTAATARPCFVMIVVCPRAAAATSAGNCLRASSAPVIWVCCWLCVMRVLYRPYRIESNPLRQTKKPTFFDAGFFISCSKFGNYTTRIFSNSLVTCHAFLLDGGRHSADQRGRRYLFLKTIYADARTAIRPDEQSGLIDPFTPFIILNTDRRAFSDAFSAEAALVLVALTLERSATTNQVHHHHDDGDDQQQV